MSDSISVQPGMRKSERKSTKSIAKRAAKTASTSGGGAQRATGGDEPAAALAKSGGTGQCGLIAIDLGEKSDYVILDTNGAVAARGRIKTRQVALENFLRAYAPTKVVFEVGTHSPWVARLVARCGHRPVVSNARKVGLIAGNRRKNNRVDAKLLADLGWANEALLHPIQHRGLEAQQDLAVLRARDMAVRARTRLITSVRNMVKSYGAQIPTCDAAAFGAKAGPFIPKELKPALNPLVKAVLELTSRIRIYDRQVHQMARRYPEVARLAAIVGVGELTALAFVLTLDSTDRFPDSRAVGAYLGLVPGSRDTGDNRRPTRITREGDALVRRLLVGAAHYILGRFGPACDLRRHGARVLGTEDLTTRNKPQGKKRAVIAVARKLAGLLYTLWKTEQPYDPDFNLKHASRSAAA